MSFLTRMRDTLKSHKPTRQLPPQDLPNDIVYTDKPSTVDTQYIQAVNTVASWLSYLGKPRRANNTVTLHLNGSFSKGTFNYKYDITIKYDAVNQQLKGDGLIQYFDQYLVESYRKIRFNTQNPQEMYFHLNSLYVELIRPQMN